MIWLPFERAWRPVNSDRVEDHERVGHGVFRSGDAGRSPPRTRFWEDQLFYHGDRLSVDRLTYAPRTVICEIHDEDAASRGNDRSFYGWYLFEVTNLRQVGVQVTPTPSTNPRNEWHADLVIPRVVKGDKDSAVAGAEKLKAATSVWEPRELNPEAARDVTEAMDGFDQ